MNTTEYHCVETLDIDLNIQAHSYMKETGRRSGGKNRPERKRLLPRRKKNILVLSNK